jgi:FtsZ-binding cell division protein ZapB
MTQSIGSFARNIIATQATLSNGQVLELVKQQFPNANTSIACIAWYKSNMKKTGYKAEVQQVERTIEVIQVEIDATKSKLEMLEQELQQVTLDTREKLEEQFAKLAKMLGRDI